MKRPTKKNFNYKALNTFVADRNTEIEIAKHHIITRLQTRNKIIGIRLYSTNGRKDKDSYSQSLTEEMEALNQPGCFKIVEEKRNWTSRMSIRIRGPREIR